MEELCKTVGGDGASGFLSGCIDLEEVLSSLGPGGRYRIMPVRYRM